MMSSRGEKQLDMHIRRPRRGSTARTDGLNGAGSSSAAAAPDSGRARRSAPSIMWRMMGLVRPLAGWLAPAVALGPSPSAYGHAGPQRLGAWSDRSMRGLRRLRHRTRAAPLRGSSATMYIAFSSAGLGDAGCRCAPYSPFAAAARIALVAYAAAPSARRLPSLPGGVDRSRALGKLTEQVGAVDARLKRRQAVSEAVADALILAVNPGDARACAAAGGCGND